ncbi:phosphopantetheine-binding protein [Streptomyces varsoviensis]|uniref:phosphopantetheine-binding protein n=1 Tax=Streptomyces varsoviensis TaxID=67373 RepID=UPI0033D2EE30
MATPTSASTASAPWDPGFEEVLRGALRLLSPDDVLAPDTCLSTAGMDSMSTIDTLMRLEDRYDVAFPDDALTGETFATPGSLWTVLSELRAQS